MPWVSGVYSRGYPSWSADAASNLPISATKFDTEDNDFAAGLNNCLTKDGLSVPTASMIWSQTNALTLQLNRGTDGNVFAIGRTGGTNNPVFNFAIADAGGLTIDATAGTGLNMSTAGNVSVLAPSTGNALSVQAAVGGFAAAFISAASGTQEGVVIQAGTANTDTAFSVRNQSGASTFFNINGAGNVTIAAPSSGISLVATGAASNAAIEAVTNNATFNATQNAALIISNANASAQTPIDFFVNGTWSGRIRNDFSGNLTYATAASGSHTFFVGGDSGVGHSALGISGAGAVSISAPTAGVAFTATGLASAFAAVINSASSGTQLGLKVNAGAASSDTSFIVQNQAASSVLFEVFGDGGVVVGAPTGGDKGAGTLNVTGQIYQNGAGVQTPVNTIASAYTAVASDANGSINNNTSGSKNVTIPSNASVPYPIGTMITIANTSGFSYSLSINSDILVWAPSGSTGTRTVASPSLLNLYKAQSTAWILTGVGIS